MKIQKSRQRLPELLVRLSLLHPLLTLAWWAAALVVLSIGLTRLQIDTTTDSVLNTRTISWAYYQYSQRLFGGDQIVVIAIPGSHPFDERVLREVDRISTELEDLDGVRRVDSLATVPVVRGTVDGELSLAPALGHPVSGAATAQGLVGDRIAPRSLVSDDGTVSAINLLLERDYADYAKIVDRARASTSHLNAWISGVPVFRSTASERTRQELLLFVPLTLLAIALLVGIAYRSARMVLIALLVGLAGSAVVVSSMGLLGAPLSLVTMLLPSIMLALGCAYSIHVISAARTGTGPLRERICHVALPVALSSLTTAIGFSAIGTIPIDEVRNVGGFGALGALTLGLATLTIAPALLSLWQAPPPSNRASSIELAARRLIVHAAVDYRRPILFGWLVVLGALALGISRIEVVTDPTQWFAKGSEVRDSYDAIGKNLSGISPINVVIESANGRPVTDPAPLAAIDGLTDFLEAAPHVGKAISIRDPLRQLHGGFLGEHSAPLPVSPNLAEQYLLLLESVDQIRDLVTADRTAANVVLRVDDNGSNALLEVATLAREWWNDHGPADFRLQTTGIMYEFALAEDEIARGQLRGLMLALAAIGLTMLVSLRSLQLSFIAMLPNVVPTAMVFGVMGWFQIPLDAGTVVIGSLALGIAVDDTIHLVSGFHSTWESGADSQASVDKAISQVLHPVTLTTAAIAIGFGLIGFSGFALTRNVGLLLAGVTIVCLVADLFLLPPLLAAVRRPPSNA